MAKLALALREERDVLVGKARNALDHAEKAGRAMDADEQSRWDKYMADVAGLEKRIKAQEDLYAAEDYSSKAIPGRSGIAPHEIRHNASLPDKRRELFVRADGRIDSRKVTDPQRIAHLEARAKQVRSFFMPEEITPGRLELRASPLQADSLQAGGATFAAEQFVAELIRLVDDKLFVRQLARVIPCTSSDSLGAPAQKANPADADWTGEVVTVTKDTAMAFDKRQLHPHILSKEVLVSDKLMRTSAIPIDAFVADRLAYKIAVTQEKAFLTGTGAGQPLGVFTASSLGISTSRDTSAASQTTWTADELLKTYYAVKSQYMQSGVWMMHRDAVSKTRQLKDGNGQYLVPMGLNNFAQAPGTFDQLLGRPLYMSEYAPNTFTTGKYAAIFGDFSRYWIAESLSMTIKRLIELYAESNEIAFIGVMDVDGMPVLEEAFSRLKLA